MRVDAVHQEDVAEAASSVVEALAVVAVEALVEVAVAGEAGEEDSVHREDEADLVVAGVASEDHSGHAGYQHSRPSDCGYDWLYCHCTLYLFSYLSISHSISFCCAGIWVSWAGNQSRSLYFGR